ncbi:MAG: hypothetical protein ACTTJ7_09260 [Treponema sp.]
MTALEKFYSDADRLVQKNPLHSDKEELTALFCRAIRAYDKQLVALAEDITQYWLDTHAADSSKEAVEWFYAVFALLDGSFQSTMDFSDNDWAELNAIVNAHADTLDMSLLHSIMNLMLSRHKLL